MKLLILIAMLFCHCIADYNLQGILASFKQKSWWKENAPDELYKYDWVIALLEHAFVWTCLVFTPIVIYNIAAKQLFIFYVFLFVGQWLIHAYVDHMKANLHKINLIQDQIVHIVQIVLTWLVYILVC